MELLNWIDKGIGEISGTLAYGRYFDTILPEQGTDVYCLLNPNAGIDLILRSDLSVKAVHLFSGAEPDTSRFKDALPAGVDFSFSQAQTRSVFGRPWKSGGR